MSKTILVTGASSGIGKATTKFFHDKGWNVISEVIWNAVTDGTDTLRYRAGADAVELLDNRKALDDATFIGGLKQQFGL